MCLSEVDEMCSRATALQIEDDFLKTSPQNLENIRPRVRGEGPQQKVHL